MKVFVAGSTGALGIPLVGELIRRGHDVVGLTRSGDKAKKLEVMGAKAVLGDVLDQNVMTGLLAAERPGGVIQILNALPKRGPYRPKELEATNELRITGTRNLLEASIHAGVGRYVAESMIFGYGYRSKGKTLTEDAPFGGPAPLASVTPALQALTSLEEQVLGAAESGRIEGAVLRYGLFYGPDVGSTDFFASMLRKRLFGLPGGGHNHLSWIHVEDGAAAAAIALEKASSGSVYNVADDEPVTTSDFVHRLATELDLPQPYSVPKWAAKLAGRYAALISSGSMQVSNAKLKSELGWQPRYPTYREGLATLRSRTAA